MIESRPRFPARTAAGAGALPLAVDLGCAEIGALRGALAPRSRAGFCVGFFLGIRVVADRFRGL